MIIRDITRLTVLLALRPVNAESSVFTGFFRNFLEVEYYFYIDGSLRKQTGI